MFIKFVYKRSSLDMKQFVLYSSFLNKNVKLKIKIYLYMYLYIYLASLVCLLDEIKIGMTYLFCLTFEYKQKNVGNLKFFF